MCGVGPCLFLSCLGGGLWSPRVRGWSLTERAEMARDDVVPACAGLVPARWRATCPLNCGPRVCGVGPMSRSPMAAPLLWSPRVRGWSRLLYRRCQHLSVVPACAGLVPPSSRSPTGLPCGPRVCGVGPPVGGLRRGHHEWSPRVRGWSLRRRGPARGDRVVPACAGLVPRACRQAAGDARGPRVCGVGPFTTVSAQFLARWSPRVRGWSRRRGRGQAGNRVVPACAGLVPSPSSPSPGRSRGPRVCGVGPAMRVACSARTRWSPRVRGWSPVLRRKKPRP